MSLRYLLCALVGSLSTASAASMSSSTSSKASSVHMQIVKCYGGLSSSSESEPYVYASIDDSWTPNSSKKIETGIGKQVADEWFFSCPVLHWQSISNWAAQSIEFGIYGKDRLRPDSTLGKATIALKDVSGLKASCRAKPYEFVVNDKWFGSEDGKCVVNIAICVEGSKGPSAWLPFEGPACADKNKV